jgi:hypothetical protein
MRWATIAAMTFPLGSLRAEGGAAAGTFKPRGAAAKS